MTRAYPTDPTWPAPKPADRIGGPPPIKIHKRRAWSARDRERLIAQLIDRDGPDCGYCGATLMVPIVINPEDLADGPMIITSVYPAHIDHKQPLSRGGDNQIENLHLTCEPCNLEKGTMLHREYLDLWWTETMASRGPGWGRPQWRDPSWDESWTPTPMEWRRR